MVASCTPWVVSSTVSLDGHRVAAIRRRRSARSASEICVFGKGRMDVSPLVALAAAASPPEACATAAFGVAPLAATLTPSIGGVAAFAAGGANKQRDPTRTDTESNCQRPDDANSDDMTTPLYRLAAGWAGTHGNDKVRGSRIRWSVSGRRRA